MPFKTFTDSRGQSHSIYMQEKNSSCGIACVATVLSLIYGENRIEESHLRLISQRFAFGYKPHPVDVKANQRTFIAELIEQRQLSGLLNTDGEMGVCRQSGMRSIAISKTLALFNLYSDKKALKEVSKADEINFAAQLKSKIVILGLKKMGVNQIIASSFATFGKMVHL